MKFTNDQRIEFLSEHPYSASRWDVAGGGKRWQVTTFLATRQGETFAEALDQVIEAYEDQAKAAEQPKTFTTAGWLGQLVFGRKVEAQS